MFGQKHRTGVFLDYSNLLYCTKPIRRYFKGRFTNCNRMVHGIMQPGERIVFKKAFVGIPLNVNIIPFTCFLEDTGWEIFTEETEVHRNNEGDVTLKCDLDTQIAFEMGKLAVDRSVSRVILISGDHHYNKPVLNLRKLGIQVDVLFPFFGLSSKIRNNCSNFYPINYDYYKSIVQ